jgi:hypothetical protein
MRRRRQANEQDPRRWVAKTGQWSSPIALTGKTARWMARSLLAPPDQAWAARAGDDLEVERREGASRLRRWLGLSARF